METFLIVNADDMGRSSAINQGIIAAYAHGIVTSASLLVNFPASAAAADLVRQYRLPVGIHFNLTEGRPISPPLHVSSLVDDQGCFWSKNVFIGRWLSHRLQRAEICREAQAQLQKCLDFNLSLDHFDSHHHIHGLPRLSHLFIQVAQRFGISRCRFISKPAWSMPWAYRLQQQTVYRANRPLLKMAIKHPDFFYGFEWMHLPRKEKALLQLISALPRGVSELMCHPSATEEKSVSSYGHRADELKALCSPAVKRAITNRAIVSISFQELT